MGKATLAYQRAIGVIGAARAQKLTDAGLVILYVDDYDKLKARVAELEKTNKLLTLGAAERDDPQAVPQGDVAAQVLREAMR